MSLNLDIPSSSHVWFPKREQDVKSHCPHPWREFKPLSSMSLPEGLDSAKQDGTLAVRSLESRLSGVERDKQHRGLLWTQWVPPGKRTPHSSAMARLHPGLSHREQSAALPGAPGVADAASGLL